MKLVPLAQALPLGRKQLGGKALGLAALVERGLPVPEGVVLTVRVFRAFLAQNGLLDSAARLLRSPDAQRARALQASIRSAALPVELAAALRSEGERLGPYLAVRSSGVEEDRERASYAGIYHTELAVRPGDALEEAVRRCWAAAFAPRALRYGERAGRRARPGIALLVQRLVRARAAGVVFTVDPMSGSWRQMIVEAAWGLGEAVAGGKVVPDHYLVQRPRRLPEPLQRVAARVRLDVLQENIQQQERQLALGRDGLGWEAVPSRLRGRRKLSRARLLQLCRLALRAEALGGCPQDVEWALDAQGELVLLQARPVTATPEPFRAPEALWTRRFIGERWNEPATALGWSLVRPMLEHFIGYPRTGARHLGGGPTIRLVDGCPYINATVFRHLAFKLPGFPPPRFMMDMLPPDEERAWLARFAAPPGVRVYAAILSETFAERRWRRFRWNPVSNHRAWDELEPRLEREVPLLVEPPAGCRDRHAALARADEGMRLAHEYVKVHVTSLLFANLWYQLTEGALALQLGARGDELARQLLRCPAGNMTVSTNHDLWSLARQARSLGVELERLPEPDSPFGQALAAFLAQHGHRSESSWEIMSARWAEQPQQVLALLRHSLRAGEQDPAERARAQAAAGARALDELHRLVTHPLRRHFLVGLVRLTRRYLELRENQRYHFDRLLFGVKRNYLLIGQGWVESGVLADAGDIRHLEDREVRAGLAGSMSPERLRAAVARRSERHARQRHLSPPDFLLGEAMERLPEVAGSRMVGLGTSPGQVRGRVRVVRVLEDAQRLRAGEILVARAMDPGWTPLFLVAAGVILELGSQLSHGSVVAREYKLPMVVNLRAATRLLRDGQEVSLDGARGVVWLHG